MEANENPFKDGEIVIINSIEKTKQVIGDNDSMRALVGTIGEVTHHDKIFVKIKGWWFHVDDISHALVGGAEATRIEVVTFDPNNLSF